MIPGHYASSKEFFAFSKGIRVEVTSTVPYREAVLDQPLESNRWKLWYPNNRALSL